MRLLVSSEGHVFQGEGGAIYAHGPSNYSFWSRYLTEFESVTILARGTTAKQAMDESSRADGPGIFFRLLPDFYGPLQLTSQLGQVKAITRQAISECDAYVIRVPGLVGHNVWREIERRRLPYALEVVGDPWDSFGPGTWPSIYRPIARRLVSRELRLMCRRAGVIHYVTRHALQRRFPPGRNARVTTFSDAVMDLAFATPTVLAERHRRIQGMQNRSEGGQQPFRIGFVGSLSRLYKGLDVLLRAVRALRSSANFNVSVAAVGDGQYLGTMKSMAARLGIQDRVQFLGQVAFGRPIFDFFDSIDLFVLPSRQEGLPRALLEAMARGCPCIGSEIGGVGELLDPQDMFPCGDFQRLSEILAALMRQPGRLREMAERNRNKAVEFNPDALMKAQRDFLSCVALQANTSPAELAARKKKELPGESFSIT